MTAPPCAVASGGIGCSTDDLATGLAMLTTELHALSGVLVWVSAVALFALVLLVVLTFAGGRR